VFLTAHEHIQWHRIFKGFCCMQCFCYPSSSVYQILALDSLSMPRLIRSLFIISLTIFFQAGFEKIFKVYPTSPEFVHEETSISHHYSQLGTGVTNLHFMGNLNIFSLTHLSLHWWWQLSQH